MKTLLKVALAIYVPVSLVTLCVTVDYTKILAGIILDPAHCDEPGYLCKLAEASHRGLDATFKKNKEKFSTEKEES